MNISIKEKINDYKIGKLVGESDAFIEQYQPDHMTTVDYSHKSESFRLGQLAGYRGPQISAYEVQ